MNKIWVVHSSPCFSEVTVTAMCASYQVALKHAKRDMESMYWLNFTETKPDVWEDKANQAYVLIREQKLETE